MNYTCNEKIRSALVAFKERNGQTNAKLAKRLNVDATRLSKYLNSVPDVDPAAMEERAVDILRAASRQRVAEVPTLPTNVIVQFRRVVEQVRSTRDLGLITGPAGIGKTRAIKEYMRENPTTILITCTEWAATAESLASHIARSLGLKNDERMRRGEMIVEALSETDWPVIIDQAQLLKGSARKFVTDLHDATDCPIIMVGNPEILIHFAKVEQQASRIGLWEKLTLTDTKEASRHLVDSILGPNQPATLYDLAHDVARGAGALRALHKQLLLARDFYGSPAYREQQTLVDAFTRAGGKMAHLLKG